MENRNNPELIFLVSQPRAGSTLLQKLLAAHSDVATTSEPWIMLPAASVFRKGSVNADFNADWAAVALESFIATLPQGRATYIEGLRRMYGHLYGQALSATKARIFLDKTPRYYLIIPQLLEIFPDAKIVLLLRNPLAVLVSIINTWTGVAPGALEVCRHDLLTAPGFLNDAIRLGGDQITVVRYEELVSSPEDALRKMCQSLPLEYRDEMLNYDVKQEQKWILGDQKKVHEEALVDRANRDRWVESLNDPAIWRLCDDYLNCMGRELYSSLGYSWKDTRAALADHRPSSLRRAFTLSLENCMQSPANEPTKDSRLRKAQSLMSKVLAMTRTPH